MLNIGVTGGIGSGKTSVCKIFESLGVPVYYADDRAKYLMENNAEIIQKVKKLFDEDIYLAGIPDRKRIAEIVFQDKEKLNALNAIIHPAVGLDSKNWQKEMEKEGHPYVLREAALIYETGMDKKLDKVIVVNAAKSIRIKRVMQRDGISEDAVLARMDKQWPQEKKNALADFLIENDGESALIPQVQHLHKILSRPN